MKYTLAETMEVRAASRDARAGGSSEPRRYPASGYDDEEPTPMRRREKAPGEGDPHEHQNDPRDKPDAER